MSFSRGNYDFSWLLEKYVYNYQQSIWVLTLNYYPLTPWPATPPPSLTFTLDAPWPGGSAQDYSPFKKPGGVHPTDPRTDYAPDPTRNAVTTFPPGAGSETLTSTLPMEAIRDGINGIAGINITASVNTDPARLGHYVSAYMAYHSCWYREYSQTEYPDKPCKKAGHTHVGVRVIAADGRKAVQKQLDVLIDGL